LARLDVEAAEQGLVTSEGIVGSRDKHLRAGRLGELRMPPEGWGD